MRFLFAIILLASNYAQAVLGFNIRSTPVINFLDEEKELSKLKPGWLDESFSNWKINVERLSNPNLSYGECANIKELQRVVLCVFPFRADLNNTFTRISVFSEGASQIQRGSILQQSSDDLAFFKKVNLGHNIPSKKMLSFFEETSKLEGELALSPQEIALKQVLTKSDLLKKNDYVIAVSLETMGDPLNTVMHELSHARLGVDRVYKKAIYDFWNSLVAEERNEIVTLLGNLYNKNQIDVIVDEWQAWTLQMTPNKISRKYRQALVDFLKEQGLDPVLM